MSKLTDFRSTKDHFVQHDPQSPLTSAQKATFGGLSYFDEEPSLRLMLQVQHFPEQEIIEMQTTTGGVASFVRWAKIAFSVDGAPAELTVYKDASDGSFFLPFADSTSGGETYGAGRYVELEAQPDGTLVVDFNYAYSPYCAYNEAWACPITPAENRLRVPIRAGEKNFK